MKRIVIIFSMISLFFAFNAFGGTYSGGSGTTADPYLISTVADMNEIGTDPNDWDKEFVLTSNIDLSGYTGTQYNIIGTEVTAFTGKFDGQGHVISNFSYTASFELYIGLFGYLNLGAEVCNLGVEDVNIYCPNSRLVGGIIGQIKEGSISNCYVSGGVIEADQSVGGIAGSTGGMVVINDCYCATEIIANNYYGALVGENDAVVNNSFYDTTVCGSAAGDGIALTTSEMYLRQTYMDEEWDFVGYTGDETWWIYDGNDYPKLMRDDYYAGNGTEDCPFLIYTAENMNTIGLHSADWNKHFLVMNDIDMSAFTGTQYNVIAKVYGQAFSGVFDGNDCIISNFSMTNGNNNYYSGLFGIINGPNAVVKNLRMNNVNINCSTSLVGGLAGLFQNGTIENVLLRNSNITGAWIVGGLVGKCLLVPGDSSSYHLITNCSYEGIVEGTWNLGEVGGITGHSDQKGMIEYSYAKGMVTSNGSIVGGVVGYVDCPLRYCYYIGIVDGSSCVGGVMGKTYSTETHGYCYAKGSVSGSSAVGGLVGYVYATTHIWHCYSAANVSGGSYTGGLIGKNDGSTSEVQYCYWDYVTSGQTSSAGGTSKSVRQMLYRNTYQGWDFVNKWQMFEGQSYPVLSYYYEKYPAGDINKDHAVNMYDLATLANNWLVEN